MQDQIAGIPQYAIKVNGADIPDTLEIVEIVVEQSVHLPDMFVIRFIDGYNAADASEAFGTFDADTFAIGAEVQIDLGYIGADLTTVTKGEITGLELEVSAETDPRVTVRGYAKSHRLHRGRYSRTFLNQKDSDIASSIASEVGLTPQVTDTSVQHDHIFQANLTNWEFLQQRAIRNGFEMFVQDQTLYFQPPQAGQQALAALSADTDIYSFQVTLSTAGQATAVNVQGWDPEAKVAIIGTADTATESTQLALGKTAGEYAALFGDATTYVVNRPVTSQDEATTYAQAVLDGMQSGFIKAEASTVGNVDIKPAATIELSGLGTRLSGNYYVTAATHRMTDGTYQTSMSVSGSSSHALLDTLVESNDRHTQPSVVVGLVTDNTDPDGGQGRVKIKFPWLVDSDQTWWARVASPMAGASRGFFFLPEVGDEVLVAFEHGDINRPYVVGCLWNGQDLPPMGNSDAVANSKVNQRLLKTRSGHTLTLDDTDGSEFISIIDKTGKNLIKIDSSNNNITIEADADIAITANANVVITSKQDTTLDVTGNATIKAQGNVDVTAQGNASVTASANATVSAQASLELKGATVKLASQGTMSIEASGPLTIKGAIVNIN